jgi:hypothetical protein
VIIFTEISELYLCFKGEEMAIDRQRRSVSYGLSQPTIGVPPEPIVSKRAPTTSDKAEIGTDWIDTTNNIAYKLVDVTANSATWSSTTSAGADVVAASFTATTGNITATVGDVEVTAGDVNIDAGDITLTAGDVFSVGAFFTGDVQARGVFVTGDEGVGFGSQLLLTNVVDTTLSTGAGTVLMKTANPQDSSGWLKIYVGTAVRYIPFWTTLSP